MAVGGSRSRHVSMAFVCLFVVSGMALAQLSGVMAEIVEVTTDLPPLVVQVAAAGVVIGDDHRIYVFGGYRYNFSAADTPLNTVMIYNMTTGTTTFGTSMQNGVAWPSCAKLADGRIAVIGGYDASVLNGTKSVRIYTPRTDSWTTNSSAPLNISRAGTAVGSDGNVYVFGPMNHQNKTLIYDPAGDSWSYGSDFAGGRARYGSSAVAYNATAIYVIGGSYFYYVFMPPGIWIPVFDDTNYVDIYNPIAGTWTTGPPLNRDRESGGAALARNGCIYYLGGQSMLGPVYDDIERLDPLEPLATASWQMSAYTISKQKSHFGTAVDDYGSMFLVGGREYPSWSHIPDVEMIAATEVTGVNEILIESPSDSANVSGVVEVMVCLKNQLGAEPVVIDLFVDGVRVESQLGGTATSWSFLWNATGEQVGTQHHLVIEALFTDGSASSDDVWVLIGSVEEGSTEQRLSEIENALVNLTEQVNLLSEDVQNISGNVSAIEAEIAELQAELAALAAEMVTLSQELGDLNTSIDLDLAAIASEMDAIAAQLAALEAELDSVETDLGGISGKVDDLIEKVEEEIRSLIENLTENARAIQDLKNSTKESEDSSSEARTYALVAAAVSTVGLITVAANLALTRKKGK